MRYLGGLSSRLSSAMRPWKPLDFSNSNFGRISASQTLEEETLPDHVASRYYPTRIGEVIRDRYQIIFIKAASMGQGIDSELKMYQRMSGAMSGATNHPGRNAIRSFSDWFLIDGPEDKHQCLVHPPLFESVWEFLHRNLVRRLPNPVLAFTLRRVFLALDYLHTECQVIHTDIKANNIMFELVDDSIFAKFEADELQNPSPRKELDERAIYMTRDLDMIPEKVGFPVLCDFGSAVLGGILEVLWSYSIDIWSVGCMIWDIFEGGSLFTGNDPEFQKYRSRAHLAEMINLLGPPPPSLLARTRQRQKFFSDVGDFHSAGLLRDVTPLERRETKLQGKDKERFLRMMRRMLQWEPEKRSSAKELADDEWIREQIC
ncbi:kinase-like domain-containing protein [Aspergillus lucknowensis]|uniref:Kinase-like domain-containing protein n=1 Tax=Aspergillus lucknowensis TaxID=176173 RepID=A0ABR4L5S7_9EURO